MARTWAKFRSTSMLDSRASKAATRMALPKSGSASMADGEGKICFAFARGRGQQHSEYRRLPTCDTGNARAQAHSRTHAEI
eukprot:14124431-Alexandrium_andersonii.AAC.1